MLSQKAIDEFKTIYKEEFGEDLSDQEALDLSTRTINLFKVIYRPIPEAKKK